MSEPKRVFKTTNMKNKDDEDYGLPPEWMKTFKEERENFEKTKIPRCITCKKPMVQDGSEYCWKHDCDCAGKDSTMRLCLL